EEGFSSEGFDPVLRLAFARSLSDRVGISSNVGIAWTSIPGQTERNQTLADLIYTLSFGFALTERVGAFAESFGSVALDEAGASEHLMDGGFTFLVLDNLQLDVSGGFSLRAAGLEKWFVGAGLAVRLPT
ncbi:MAG: transporter, partial [Acidobacteriota bacterium]